MIIAIRIIGNIGMTKLKRDSLDRLMLRNKYNAVLLPEGEMPKIFNVKDEVMFGKIDEKTLKELLAKRGRKGNKPLSAVNDSMVKALLEEKTSLRKEGLKPYFRLHPPIGGWKRSTKLPYPVGILGKNEKINEWVMRML